MKYKVGDRVRVRDDLEVGKFYGHYFSSLMAELKGKVVEIKDLGRITYSIKEDENCWSEEMFSGLAEEPRNLIPLIAKELGVEIGEEFEVYSNNGYVYMLDELLLYRRFIDHTFSVDYVGFNQLLNGELVIKKLPPKLTEDERAILKNLPKEYKYIARDMCGELYVYKNKPKKEGNLWFNCSCDNLRLFQHLFQSIKWEDKEPYNIEELLKGE